MLFDYLSSRLPRESVHQLLHAVVHEDGGVVQELGVWDFISVNEKAVWHQRVPVVEMAELQGDAVSVLETHVEEQGGVIGQLQMVATQVLHVLLYNDVDYLTWEQEIISVKVIKTNEKVIIPRILKMHT